MYINSHNIFIYMYTVYTAYVSHIYIYIHIYILFLYVYIYNYIHICYIHIFVYMILFSHCPWQHQRHFFNHLQVIPSNGSLYSFTVLQENRGFWASWHLVLSRYPPELHVLRPGHGCMVDSCGMMRWIMAKVIPSKIIQIVGGTMNSTLKQSKPQSQPPLVGPWVISLLES